MMLMSQAVTQPELSVRRRMKKNLKKQEAKKRKIVEIRHSKRLKKRKSLSEPSGGSVDTF